MTEEKQKKGFYFLKIGFLTFNERSKDDIIQTLMHELTERNEVSIKLTYPDGTYYLLDGWGEDGWKN